MESYKVKFWRAVQSFCLVIAVLFGLGGIQTASAVQDVTELPTVTRWLNGYAVSDESGYLIDTWAVDDTGVSEKRYVLVGQNGEEAMRVANYPDDIGSGDTAICELNYLSASLDVPEGVSGDVYVTFESDGALYTSVFTERSGYVLDLLFYPGVYRVTGVELASGSETQYSVGNDSDIDVTVAGNTVSLTVVEALADGEGDVEVDSALVSDDASASDASSASSDAPSNGAEDDGGSGMSERNKDLLADTIKLAVAVLVLLGIYGVIQWKRGKSEELKR